MKRIVPLAVLAMSLATQAVAGPAWLKTVGEAQKIAKQKNQMIFVDLFANWCGWCHRFEAEVTPSPAFQEATKNMVLLRLNTEDRAEGTNFSRKYQVTSLPTFLVLTPDLAVAGVIKGYAPAAQFAKTLTETVAQYNTFLQKAKNESKIEKDYDARLELAREFIQRRSYAESETRLKRLMTEKGVPPNVRDGAYYELAVSYVLQQRLQDGLDTVTKLRSLSKKGEPVERARLLAGQILMQQGNLAGAASELRDFKDDFPNSPLINTVDMVLPDIERRLAMSK